MTTLEHKRIALLGSTGSIGTQTLQVCRNLGFSVSALTAHSNVKLLEQQVREFSPAFAVIGNPDKYGELKMALADTGIRVAAGPEAVCEAAAWRDADTTVNAIVGIAGLRPTLEALGAGKDVALSNKESLVTGGELVMKAVREQGVNLLPVDSEHSAVWQCLQSGRREDIRGMILTASGGPFFGKTANELSQVTVREALAHPNWSMGAKITVDSSTLMNKGLELIEAMWLFGLNPRQIEVVVHRQSVIHSAVEFADGSVIAQLGIPDMRLPIQYALTYPRHLPQAHDEKLSLTQYRNLSFEAPDLETFQCLAVCMEAAERGGLAPCIVNGANEMAVELFLQEKITFLDIGRLVGAATHDLRLSGEITLSSIEKADRLAREYVRAKV